MQVAHDLIVLDQSAAKQNQKWTDIPASVGHDHDLLDCCTKLGGCLSNLTQPLVTRHGDKEIGTGPVVSHEWPEHFPCQIRVVDMQMEGCRRTQRIVSRRRMLGPYNVEEPGPFGLSGAKIMRKWIDEGRIIKFGIRISVYSRV